jgi:hypothetical protein
MNIEKNWFKVCNLLIKHIKNYPDSAEVQHIRSIFGLA